MQFSKFAVFHKWDTNDALFYAFYVNDAQIEIWNVYASVMYFVWKVKNEKLKNLI